MDLLAELKRMVRRWLGQDVALPAVAEVDYVPLGATERALRIVEVERLLRREGLRGAAARLVTAEDTLRYYQAVLAQWQDVQAFKQFCIDVRQVGHVRAGARQVPEPLPVPPRAGTTSLRGRR